MKAPTGRGLWRTGPGPCLPTLKSAHPTPADALRLPLLKRQVGTGWPWRGDRPEPRPPGALLGICPTPCSLPQARAGAPPEQRALGQPTSGPPGGHLHACPPDSVPGRRCQLPGRRRVELGGEPRVHFLTGLAHPRGRRDRPPPRPPQPPDSPRAGWPREAGTGKWKLLGAPDGRVSQGSPLALDEAKPPSGPLCSHEDCSLASVEGTGLGPPHSPRITTGPRAALSTPGSSPSPQRGERQQPGPGTWSWPYGLN